MTPRYEWWSGTLRAACAFVAGLLLSAATLAQTTAFTYQGKLTDGGVPANASYDLQFKLFDTATSGTGTQQGATHVVNPAVASAGIFTVTLDFGQPVFSGADRYLEVGVRPSGSVNAYTILAPRQHITSAPYALETLNTQQLGGLPASRYLATDANGSVGIGMAPTTSRVAIAGQDGLSIWGYQPFITLRDGNAGNAAAYLQGANGDAALLTNSKAALVLKDGTGNVGLGTSFPSHHLDIVGGPSWTNSFWAGALSLSNASALGWRPDAAGNAFGIGQTTGGLYIFNSTSTPGTTGAAANYLFQVADNGDLVQRPYNGGLLKGGALVNSDASLNLCYNSQTPGSCGISVNHVGTGIYDVTFPFQINSRFLTATIAINPNLTITTYDIAARPISTQTIRVYTGDGGYDASFYLNGF